MAELQGPRSAPTRAILLCTRQTARSPQELETWAFKASTAETPEGVETYCLLHNESPWQFFGTISPEGWPGVMEKHLERVLARHRTWEAAAASRPTGPATHQHHRQAGANNPENITPAYFQHEFTTAQWDVVSPKLVLVLAEPQQEPIDENTPDPSSLNEPAPPLPPPDPAIQRPQPPVIAPRPAPLEDAKPIYASQKLVARRLFERIQTCMRELGSPMDTFSEIDFRILTAGFNTLKEQTVRRLEGLLPQDRFPLPGEWPANRRLVLIYGAGADQRASFEDLRQSATANPHRLHVIIADEAHWGATSGGWNSYYVNDVDGTTQEHRGLTKTNPVAGELLRRPNVLVLLVTATPFNLLSRHSRVPQRNAEAHGNDYHVVSWDEQVLAGPPVPLAHAAAHDAADELARMDPAMPRALEGPVLRCRLATFFNHAAEGSAPATEFLTVVTRTENNGSLAERKLSVSPAGTEVGIFVAAGPGVGVSAAHHVAFRVDTARGLPEQWLWLAIVPPPAPAAGAGAAAVAAAAAGPPGNLKPALRLIDDRANAALFRVHQEHGYSVAALELLEITGPDLPLRETGAYVLVTSVAGPGAGFAVGLGDHDESRRLEWQFFVHPLPERLPNGRPGMVYRSLNYYFNTMRISAYDRRLIRTDPFLEAIVPRLTYRELAADYAYSILHFRVFFGEDCLLATANIAPTAQKLLSKPREWFQERFRALDVLVDQFDQRFGQLLDASDGDRGRQPVPRQDRLNLRRHLIGPYRDRVRRDCDAVLSREVAPDSEDGQLKLWSALKHDPQLANDADETRFFQVLTYLQEMQTENPQASNQNFNYAKSETEILIEDLIVNNTANVDGRRVMNGRMKIVRIFQESLATHFYFAVLLASDLARFRHTFCVLRDYAKFDISEAFQRPAPQAGAALAATRADSSEYAFWTDKLTRPRGAPESWTPDQYEHLDKLPCILVLVQKGRMGDTFPSSFNCMDIRLSYASKSNRVELSTLVQELGRLCRYTPVDDSEEKLPYAIVSGVLHQRLASALEKSLSLAVEFSRNPDGYLRFAPGALGRAEIPRRWQHMDPVEKHYDCVPTGQIAHPPHDRRFVLLAEPQIGKTGTYLHLLHLISNEIRARPWRVVCPNWNENPLLEGSDPAIWEYPHWRLMEKFRPTMADQEVSKGKYDAENPVYPGQSWHYGLEFPRERIQERANAVLPNDAARPAHADRRRGGLQLEPGNEEPDDNGDNATDLNDAQWLLNSTAYTPSAYPHEAYSLAHACPSCAPAGSRALGDGVTELQLDLQRIARATGCSFAGQLTTTVWVPSSVNLAELTVQQTRPGYFEPKATLDAHDIRYWILTPSARPNKARLNLHHALDGKRAEQIVFCRKAHAAAFRTSWGRRKLIVVLPDRMKYDETDGPIDVPVELGVGFSRLFMQLFAETFAMPFVFMMDDNIFHMAELVLPLRFRNKESTTARRVYESAPCALGPVLAHLQAPALHAASMPAPALAYTYASDNADTPSVVNVSQPLSTLEAYMGSISKYALFGTFRCDVLTTTAAPFKRGHVYSLVLLNVGAVQKVQVRFRPWPFWEDLNFNEQCDRKGLWVCKANRFIQLKRWQPLPGGRPPTPAPTPPDAPQVPTGLYQWPVESIVRWRVGDLDANEPQTPALRAVLERIVNGLGVRGQLNSAHVCVAGHHTRYYELRNEVLHGALRLGQTTHDFPEVGPPTSNASTTYVLVDLALPGEDLSFCMQTFFENVVSRLGALHGASPATTAAANVILVQRAVRRPDATATGGPDQPHVVYDWSELRGGVARVLRTAVGRYRARDRSRPAPVGFNVVMAPASFNVFTVSAPAALTSPTMLVLQMRLEAVAPRAASDEDPMDVDGTSSSSSGSTKRPASGSSPASHRDAPPTKRMASDPTTNDGARTVPAGQTARFAASAAAAAGSGAAPTERALSAPAGAVASERALSAPAGAVASERAGPIAADRNTVTAGPVTNAAGRSAVRPVPIAAPAGSSDVPPVPPAARRVAEAGAASTRTDAASLPMSSAAPSANATSTTGATPRVASEATASGAGGASALAPPGAASTRIATTAPSRPLQGADGRSGIFIVGSNNQSFAIPGGKEASLKVVQNAIKHCVKKVHNFSSSARPVDQANQGDIVMGTACYSSSDAALAVARFREHCASREKQRISNAKASGTPSRGAPVSKIVHTDSVDSSESD